LYKGLEWWLHYRQRLMEQHSSYHAWSRGGTSDSRSRSECNLHSASCAQTTPDPGSDHMQNTHRYSHYHIHHHHHYQPYRNHYYHYHQHEYCHCHHCYHHYHHYHGHCHHYRHRSDLHYHHDYNNHHHHLHKNHHYCHHGYHLSITNSIALVQQCHKYNLLLFPRTIQGLWNRNTSTSELADLDKTFYDTNKWPFMT